ncbi:MAG: transporter [Leptospiraceae bacterium]|nr:MAG: transporter [Leptospiraceae bacterium]
MIDLLILILLSLGNGFFSASEIALISIKKGRLKTLIEENDKRAELIAQLQKDPNRLFATVQIGVTLIGTIASVFGGATLVGKLSTFLRSIILPSFIVPFTEEISFVIIVLFITYLQIVVGELVPKSLALHYSEKVALMIAYPLTFFNQLFFLFSEILTFLSNILLKPFKDKTSFSETKLLAEEILHLLEEGVKEGTIESSEHEMIENILEMNDTDAREVMIPRVEMVALPVDATKEEILKAMESMYSRIPIYKENLDNIVGILHIKDLIRALWKDNIQLGENQSLSLAKLVRPPYFVPEGMKIGKILKEMQKRKTHMAIVVDEYGGTAGILTLEDILEEIVGDIEDITEVSNDEKDIIKLSDDIYLVSGSCNIFDFNEFVNSDVIPESEAYTTVAGFIIEYLGRFPEINESIEYNGYKFTLLKKNRQRIIQFRVEKINQVAHNVSNKI